MKIVVKVRYNATKERFEPYDGNRYIAYMSFSEDEDSDGIINTKNILLGLISKKMGIPVNKIEFKGKDFMKNWIFELG
jgi:hypothetical protein